MVKKRTRLIEGKECIKNTFLFKINMSKPAHVLERQKMAVAILINKRYKLIGDVNFIVGFCGNDFIQDKKTLKAYWYTEN